ncbi:LuxR family two component transcriptional regulator [Leucobacter komagatae]|uniref:LuxR family two component transcriptional regulator n=1 Tax=Leucobacter komagatae TaxID=55969 RepID=A0A542Y8N6_9MICO|nr:response regulator transcription factor [Leucobacter komagatae]TQL44442.1 LuxR family two component transcriptional regulator [Leucobacter komagatae]
MEQPVRVIIADDHEAVRSGVAAILGADDGIEVVAEAENGFDALAACHRERPDVALIDLRMPGTDGVWATERITAETATRVLVLTTYDSGDLIASALAAGAHGYLLKSTGGSDLIDAVHHVAADRHVLDPAVAGSVIAGFAAAQRASSAGGSGGPGGAGSGPGSPAGLADLTPRERQVLELLVAGMSNQQIADELHIGLTTVKTHVGSLYAKSGAGSRVQLAALGASAI